jgi:hypothetical protein
MRTCDPAGPRTVSALKTSNATASFYWQSRQEASKLICNNVNDYHSSRNLWDVGVIQWGEFHRLTRGLGWEFQGMTGCTGGWRRWIIPSVCLSVCHTTIHPHIPPTHTVIFAFLISPRNMWQWKKMWLVIEITGSMLCCWVAACKVIFRIVKWYFHWNELKKPVD